MVSGRGQAGGATLAVSVVAREERAVCDATGQRPVDDWRDEEADVSDHLRQVRCPHCGWRLFDWTVSLRPGERVVIKCRGCRQLVVLMSQGTAA